MMDLYWKQIAGLMIFGPVFLCALVACWAEYRHNQKITYRSYLKRDWRDRPIQLQRWQP